jgi:3-hydroxyacyl-[acyl-carrier-protein] dehydratase
MDVVEIQRILPHRYPFLMIDRVLEVERMKRIVAIKNVTINEPWFHGHFPGHPLMPGVLIIEAMAQAGGVLLLIDVPDRESKLVVFTGIDGAKFRRPVVPGDTVRFEVSVTNWRSRVGKMYGVALVGDKKVCEATLSCMLVPRKLEEPVANG